MCGFAALALGVSAATQMAAVNQQSALANSNAKIARAEARQVEHIGRVNEERSRSRMDRLISRQRADLASRGVQLNSTSALAMGEEASTERAIEAQAQRFNTDSRATSLRNEARIYKYKATTGRQAGMFGVAARTLTATHQLWPDLMPGMTT